MKPVSAARAQRLEILSALILTLFLVGMHLVLLMNRGPLWRDEISSLTLANAPTLSRFWAALTLDPLPALFPLTLRYWAALVGDADFPLRILGCLIGLACLGAFWLNARLNGRQTPIFALVLLGFCPTLVIWGDSLRGYGLGVFWIVVAFALFWRLIEQPTPWIFAATTGAAIGSVHAVYTNALLIFACGVTAAIVAVRRGQWQRAGLSLGAGALAGLSLLPYVTLFQATASWASLGQIDFSLRNSFFILSAALLWPAGNLFWQWLLLVVAAIVTACVLQRRKVFARLEPARRDALLYALFSAVGGFVCTMAFFRIVGWGTNVWYYLPMLAVAAVAIDLTFDFGTLFRLGPLVRVGAAVVALCFSLPLAIRAVEVRASNIDRAAELVSRKAATDDLIVVWPSADGITFGRYVRQPLNWVTVPVVPHLPALPGDDVLAPFREPNVIQPILDRIDATLRAGHRVWLVSTWALQLPKGDIPPVLPLDKTHPHGIGYFLRGWGFLLAAEFQKHAAQMQLVDLNDGQPVSVYEKAMISIFSGWKEAGDERPLTTR